MPYTSSKAVTGQGLTLAINTGTIGTPVWTTIGEQIGDFSIGVQPRYEDSTNQQSTGVEQIPLLPGFSAINAEFNYVLDDAGQVALITASWTPPVVAKQFKATYAVAPGKSTAETHVFLAFPQCTISQPTDKKSTLKATLTITGNITRTAAT